MKKTEGCTGGYDWAPKLRREHDRSAMNLIEFWPGVRSILSLRDHGGLSKACSVKAVWFLGLLLQCRGLSNYQYHGPMFLILP